MSLRVPVFLRDDDANICEETLSALLDICRARTVPLCLAVIPASLTPEAATLLRREPLAEVHQHGWCHANHEIEGRKCEFGPSRGLEQQRRDIGSGKQRMDEMFEGEWFRAFTPPWNRCTAETCQVLNELGFEVLSTDHRRGIPGLTEIPVTIDLHRQKNGVMVRTPEQIRQELELQMAAGGPVGLLLHHKVMDRPAFGFLDELLTDLRSRPQVEFHTLASLARTA